MRIYRIARVRNEKELLERLGVRDGGISIISRKMETIWIYIGDLPTPAANILKQDALSVGAELAVPGGTVVCESEKVDAVLIGDRRRLETLARKERAQPFGLRELGRRLSAMLKDREYPIHIMGVLNANDDSFYSGSRFMGDDASRRIVSMIEEGADIVDIGGVSSRPGSKPVGVDEEMSRVRPLIDRIYGDSLYEKALFSIDSYTPEVVEYALKRGFGIVNDITGASDDRIVSLTAEYGARICIMHMKGTPETMQKNPVYDDIMDEVDRFFEERIEKCEKAGIERENIILDTGIGFGKSLEHNLTLIRNQRHFQHFGCRLLIGASRKSMIDHISPTPVEERLPGTLAIHLKAVEEGASIVRCHDVAEHKQALAVHQRLVSI